MLTLGFAALKLRRINVPALTKCASSNFPVMLPAAFMEKLNASHAPPNIEPVPCLIDTAVVALLLICIRHDTAKVRVGLC
jgi:hypothetical protein